MKIWKCLEKSELHQIKGIKRENKRKLWSKTVVKKNTHNEIISLQTAQSHQVGKPEELLSGGPARIARLEH